METIKAWYEALPVEDLKAAIELIMILLITILTAYIYRVLYRRSILKATTIMNNDPTSYKFLAHVGTALIYIIGISIAIYETHSLRTVAKSLLATAGIFAVAIGFASQQALSNIVSGIFIVIFKPFRVNQRIKIKDNLHGLVEDITLRHVIIRDFENRRIIIPNTVISQEVIINADIEDVKICKWIEFNIALDSNVDLAKQILQDEVSKHRLFIDNRTPEQKEAGTPEVIVRVIEIGSYFQKLRAWAWANNSAEAFEMGCDLNETVKKRFDQEGIVIPVPRHTIDLKDLMQNSLKIQKLDSI
jgi:small conductance mechanosensitive channel